MPLAERKIGTASVPPLGFGAMSMSAFYGSPETDENRFKLLDAALEKGCTHWDTSDAYADSEVVIGKWFAKTGKRKDIYLATKFGYTMNGAIGTPEYARQQLERSLERLQTDYIDLYYLHRPDINTPIEVSVGAMVEFIKEGKVKQIGLSEVTAADLRRAHAVHPIAALQIEYSPFVLDIETPELGILQAAKELGVTIVAYSPLGRGLFTGRYKSPDDFEEGDYRRLVPKYSKENFPRVLEIVAKVSDIGKKYGATSGQVAIAWVLAQGPEFVTIPGTKSVKYLVENAAAADVQLSEEDNKAMREIAVAAATALPGDRVSPKALEMILKDTPPLPA